MFGLDYDKSKIEKFEVFDKMIKIDIDKFKKGKQDFQMRQFNGGKFGGYKIIHQK